MSTIWNYEACYDEKTAQNVIDKIKAYMNDELITRPHYPKIALMDVKGGYANGVIFWSKDEIKPEDKTITRWVIKSAETQLPSSDLNGYKVELYDPIEKDLESLDDTQAAMAVVFASDYSGGTAYITLMYPEFED